MADRPSQRVYFVSECTGITAEVYGHSLLSQFAEVDFHTRYLPYVNTRDKAQALVREIAHLAEAEGNRPIIFATMGDEAINAILKTAEAHYYELFDRFLPDLTRDTRLTLKRQSGMSHAMRSDRYDARLDAINYALANDDGMKLNALDQADAVVVGVSRSGKTPTCLYLALHFNLRAANYPLTEEDFERDRLPDEVLQHTGRIVALTIDPQRLAAIRERRRPGSSYAELGRCRREVQQAEALFRRYQFPVLDSTSRSIEELAAQIVKNQGAGQA